MLRSCQTIRTRLKHVEAGTYTSLYRPISLSFPARQRFSSFIRQNNSRKIPEWQILTVLGTVTAAFVISRDASRQIFPRKAYKQCIQAHEARVNGNPGRALYLYKQALNAVDAETGDSFHLFEIYFRMGLCYEDLHDWKLARIHFEKACDKCKHMIAQFPPKRVKRQQVPIMYAVALTHLSDCYRRRHKKPSALDALHSAVQLIEPHVPELNETQNNSNQTHIEFDGEKQMARVSLAGILYNRSLLYMDVNQHKHALEDAQSSFVLCEHAIDHVKLSRGVRKVNIKHQHPALSIIDDVRGQLRSSACSRVYQYTDVSELEAMQAASAELVAQIEEKMHPHQYNADR